MILGWSTAANTKLNDEACSGHYKRVSNPDEDIISPGYPRKYPNNAKCLYNIKAPEGYYVELYPAFDGKIQPSKTCEDFKTDYIHTFDYVYRKPNTKLYLNKITSCKSFSNVNPLTRDFSMQPSEGWIATKDAKYLHIM